MQDTDIVEPNVDKLSRVNLTLNPELADGLTQLCEQEGRTKVGYLRWLIAREMRSHEIGRN